MGSVRLCALAGGLLLSAAAGGYAAGGPGTGAADFLKIPVGARETSLGGAFTAVADNADAVYYNPAGLNLLQSPEAAFSQNKFVEGVSQQWFAGAYPYKAGVFGFGANYLSVSAFDAYDTGDNRTGSVAASNLALYLSWGGGSPLDYKFIRAVSYGATVKYISETLDTERGSGYGLDLGVLADSPVENLRFGLNVENAVSSRIKFIEKGARPPLTFKTGATYALRTAAGPVLRGSLDYVFRGDRAGYIAAGLESVFFDVLSLRMGYSAFDDISNGLNFGLGFFLSKYTGRDISVDYSFSPTYAFGDIHKLSVAYKFGAQRNPVPQAAIPDEGTEDALNVEPAAPAPSKAPIEYYAEVLKNGSLYQRRSAVAELGARGGEDSFALLLGLLKNNNALIVRDAVSVLSGFKDPRVIDPLIELLKVDNEHMRLAAVSGLAQYRDPRVLAALAGSLDDRSPAVRAWAAEVLGKWNGFNAEAPLQEALKKEQVEKVRRAITGSLKKLDAAPRGTDNDR